MNAKANPVPPRILLVGLQYGLPETDSDEFYTEKHFLDYDIVILDPQGALQGPGHDYRSNIHDDILSLDEDAAVWFHRRFMKTAGKLMEFVKRGGMAVVFIRPMPTVEYRGTNRDLAKYLPWKEGTIRRAHGTNIAFTHQGATAEFWKTTYGFWSYEAVIDVQTDIPAVANVKGHPDQIVAAHAVTENRGHVLLTPAPTRKKVAGNTMGANVARGLFVKAVNDLYETLRTEGPAPKLPDWADNYRLPGESNLRNAISAGRKQIETLHDEVRQRSDELGELCLHKLLVTGYDTALERAVDRVLTELGLKVKPGPKGRVDRTATYGDRKFAIEVQGVKRGAKEDHARALTIWVNEVALQDGGEEPKGLLVVNPYRDTPLADRSSASAWPNDTIKICERQRHCAITGLQLLGLYLDATTDEKKREELIERMFNTNGLFEGYEDWDQFLKPVEGDG